MDDIIGTCLLSLSLTLSVYSSYASTLGGKQKTVSSYDRGVPDFLRKRPSHLEVKTILHKCTQMAALRTYQNKKQENHGGDAVRMFG